MPSGAGIRNGTVINMSKSLEIYNGLLEIQSLSEKLISERDSLKKENESLKETNTRLMNEIKLLTEVIRAMSKPPTTTLPGIPTYPIDQIPPIKQWYGNCPRCGLKLEGVMGYVCPNADCPTGLGGSKC